MQDEVNSDLDQFEDNYEAEDAFDEEVESSEDEHESSNEEDSKGQEDEKPKKNWVDFNKPLDEQKDTVKARIDELTRKAYKADILQAEIEKLKAPKPEAIKEVSQPETDLYFENREEYEKQLAEYNRYQLQLMQRDGEEKREKEHAERVAKQEFERRIVAFNERAKAQSVDDAIVKSGAQLLVDYQVSNDVVELLIDDDQGPLLLSKINSDIDHAYAMSKLTPAKAVQYIERVLRPSLSPKKKTSAPPPVTKASHSRGAESKPGNKGRTYF